MRTIHIKRILFAIVIFTMLVTACTKPTPVPTSVPTEVVKPTAAPTEPPATVAPEPIKLNHLPLRNRRQRRKHCQVDPRLRHPHVPGRYESPGQGCND
jgi:hypothetical protein